MPLLLLFLTAREIEATFSGPAPFLAAYLIMAVFSHWSSGMLTYVYNRLRISPVENSPQDVAHCAASALSSGALDIIVAMRS